MLLTLIRTDMLPGKTFGLLDVDGVFHSHTLEDEDRKLEVNPTGKVYGETCIPRGKYIVVLDFSMRFKRVLPHVLGVHGFDGIRIHPLNTAVESQGCIGPGDERDENGIKPGTSKPAMNRLMEKLMVVHLKKEQIMLEIK